MNNSNFLILTCDGGGIRGLITAIILQELDKQIPFLDKIDLFAGTSTGGLIALGLASGVPVADLVGIYNSTNCSQIFTPYEPRQSDSFVDRWIEELTKDKDLGKGVIGILEVLNDLLYVKYNNTGLVAVIKDNLTQFNKPLATLQSKVLVTTFQLYNASESNNPSWRPITLDNLPLNQFNLPLNQFKSEDTLILDAALCTSAAPTYFPPHQHPSFGLCVDGGVFANNPSTLALARVLGSGILGEQKLENIRMLSVGTGITQNYLPPSYQPDGPLRYGPTTWLWPEAIGNTPRIPLLSILMDGSSTLDDFQLKMILGDQQYQRMNVDLTEPIPLDGCSQIQMMQDLVAQYTQSHDWQTKLTWIKNNFLQ